MLFEDLNNPDLISYSYLLVAGVNLIDLNVNFVFTLIFGYTEVPKQH